MFSNNSDMGRSQLISAVLHLARLQSSVESSLKSQSKHSRDSFMTAKGRSSSSISQSAEAVEPLGQGSLSEKT